MRLEQLAEIMKKNGVVGAGGAGFPSYGKLDSRCDTVILNCAECEPLFKVHRQVLAEYAGEILCALTEVADAVSAKSIVVAVKGSYKAAIEAVMACADEYPSVTVKKLPEVYPAGDEIVTIFEATGRVVQPGKLPISAGVIVYNVETMLNTYYAIKDKPVTTKYVTVAGEVKTPSTFVVPVGTQVSELIKLAGGETTDKPAYICGGVMTGKIFGKSDVVTKTTNAVLVLPENHPAVLKRQTKNTISLKRAKSSCCQCRMCTDLCPRHLLGYPIEPHKFMLAAANGDYKMTDAFLNTAFCSQCGLCEMYACGQMLSPRMLINECKTKLRASKAPVPEVQDWGEAETRKFRKIPMDRLTTRLGLDKYNVPAPIENKTVQANKVKIMLNQHIGARCVPIVAEGDSVKTGQAVGEVGKNLGASVHASIDGTVTRVTDSFIMIERDR